MPKGAKKTDSSAQAASKSTKSPQYPKLKPYKRNDGSVNKKQKLSKKELKELEKQQRQKAYIAPTKPQPARPDPLDSTGLAYVLPPELVIVLRNLGKKAVKTREKALDELANGWLIRSREGQEQTLVDMLPVWVRTLQKFMTLI